MGKASKWLQKLLTRKREDKEENKDSLEDSVLPTAIFPGTLNQKRRWSFGKSAASTDNNNHKTSRSLDAIDSTRLVPLDLLEYRSEHEFSTNYSERFSVSKQELQSQVYTNPSPLTNTSFSQYEDFFYGTPNRISQQKYNVCNFGHVKAPESPSVDYSGTTSHNSQFGHNYMANIHSSRANLRSSSEPKQRPFKQKTMRSPSFGGINTTPDTRDQNQASNGQKKQPPWSIKRYIAAKSSKDMEYDSNRIGTSSSSSYRTLRHKSLQ